MGLTRTIQGLFLILGGVILFFLIPLDDNAAPPVETTSVARVVESAAVPKRKLEFVHITKTGGSAIEKAAAKAGVMWGSCHYWKIPRLGCETPDWKPHESKMPPFKFASEPWHTPPRWLVPNTYEGAATFTVVRNPYDRFISEFYCSAWGYHGSDWQETAVMNDWIQKNITGITIRHGHMLPQHYYVFDEHGNQRIDYVLRYEHLRIDFPKLMQIFNLSIALPPKQPSPQKDAFKKCTRDDLTTETIRIINEYAADDFKKLHYDMIEVGALPTSWH